MEVTDARIGRSPETTIFTGRRIVAMDGSEPEAFAVMSGHVTATGSRDRLCRLFPGADRVDLDGAMVLPGFNDAHCHTSQAALQRVRVDVSGVRDVPELLECLRRRAENTPNGEWVVGQGLDEHAVKGTVDRAVLDRASRAHPIVVMQYTFHRAVANSAGLDALGYRTIKDAPAGGQLLTDPAGHLNGWLVERAWLDPWLPGPHATTIATSGPIEAQVAALREVHQELHSVGITSYCDAIVTPTEETLYEAALAQGALTPRVNMLIWHSYARLDDTPWHPSGAGHLRTAGVKMMLDGALSGGTCLCHDPYPSSTGQDNGIQILTDDEFTVLFERASRAGARVAVHANGDAAIDKVLDHAERFPVARSNHRIEHRSVLPSRLLDRLERTGAIPVPFGPFVRLFGKQILDFYVSDRAEMICAHRSLLERGIPVAGSSDYPIVPIEPLLAIQSMVTRRTADGSPVGLNQRISPLQAAWVYTVGSAHATGEQSTKGQLAAGQAADFITLDRDITATPEDSIVDANVTSTWIDGTCVWHR